MRKELENLTEFAPIAYLGRVQKLACMFQDAGINNHLSLPLVAGDNIAKSAQHG